MGLCIKCRDKQAVNKDSQCLDCSREYYRKFYDRRRILGICIKCNNKNNGSSLLCIKCSEKAKTAQNDRRIKAKKNFRCVACGKPTDGQHTECDSCRQKRNNKFVWISEERHCENICGQCGKNIPKEGLYTCEQCLEKARRYYQTVRQKRIDENRRIKLLVFNHYGHKCSCCSESCELLLNIDHVNNDGKKHRQVCGTSKRIYQDIIDQGFPDLYQLLCWNCNMGKYLNGGVCPHKKLSVVYNLVVG